MTMKHTALTLAIISIFIWEPATAQKSDGSEKDEFRIMFYNVENLFDPFHDTLKNDYEFVSGGINGWTWKKFERKLHNISKVIIATGGWKPPEIVAFSEIENRFVLQQLLKRTTLDRFGYGIIHEESPDLRGIDVGMLYLKDKFRVVKHQSVRITSSDTLLITRDILYVKGLIVQNGIVCQNDTLHLFINHWPSRTGGPAITAYRRKDAALTLKRMVDSILLNQPDAHIVLTGDFNDEPIDESISTHLNVHESTADSGYLLYNLMTPFVGKYDIGTNKYKNQWGVIDQFIVSSSLLKKENKQGLRVIDAQIISFPFLLRTDENYSGTVPYRTYHGKQYIGGFSDHLPVLLTLQIYN